MKVLVTPHLFEQRVLNNSTVLHVLCRTIHVLIPAGPLEIHLLVLAASPRVFERRGRLGLFVPIA